jgi:NADPH2:quinone reductase
MRLIRQYEFGGPQTLRYETADDLVPAPGQVRVDVAAAGVHLIDTKIRSGVQMGPFPLPALPMTPGREVAGVVGAVGPGVGAHWLGARVVAHLGQTVTPAITGGTTAPPAQPGGGYAEQALANVEALHRLPGNVSFEHAVAMIGTGRTTIAVLEVAQLSADDVVLVTSAAGGMGALLVQAAHNTGASVIAAAGGLHKLEGIKAEITVDYREPGWADGLEPTVVLDGVGGEAGKAALRALTVGGRFVIFGWSSGTPTEVTTSEMLAKGLTITALGPRLLRRPGGLRDLEERALAEAAAGRLVPVVQKFALAEAAAAHEAIETRATVGKTVLVP